MDSSASGATNGVCSATGLARLAASARTTIALIITPPMIGDSVTLPPNMNTRGINTMATTNAPPTTTPVSDSVFNLGCFFIASNGQGEVAFVEDSKRSTLIDTGGHQYSGVFQKRSLAKQACNYSNCDSFPPNLLCFPGATPQILQRNKLLTRNYRPQVTQATHLLAGHFCSSWPSLPAPVRKQILALARAQDQVPDADG